MKQLLRFKTFLLMAIFSILAGTSAWAQSDYSATYTSNVTLPTSGTNESSCIVVINSSQYDGIKLGKSNNGGSASITVPAGTKYIHLHVAAWKGKSPSFTYTVGSGSAKTISGITADAGISNNSPFTFSGDPSSTNYYKVITLESALTAATSVTFTSTSERVVFWGVNTEEEGSSENPSISAENVNITYDATAGQIAYTVNNPATSGSVSASTTSDWLSVGNGNTSPVAFTCSANSAGAERTATVTLTYTYGNNETVTKDVTVTQAANPNVVDNISDITAAGTYTVAGTIVAKSTRGFIVGDGTGYVYYYNTSYDQSSYNIGDMVKLSGSVVAYGGVFEFNSSTTVTPADASNYVAEDPTVISGADMDSRVASTTPTQLSSYVQYEGTLSVNGTYYNITDIDGASKAQGSISYPINTEFTSLNGKTVVVKGYFVGISSSKYYNTLIGSIEAVAVSVEAPSFSPAAGTYSEAQNVTISCATDGADIYYTTDGTTPDANSTPYTGAIAVVTTTTIKAIAYLGGESSTVATATYFFCSAANPYTVTEALDFPEYPANGVYVSGVVSTAPTQSPTNNGELTYYISVDGQATDQLEVYKGKGLNEAGFTAQDDIQVGDEVTIYGNVVIYGTSNPIKEFAAGNYLVAFNRPVTTVNPPTFDITEGEVEAGTVLHITADQNCDVKYTTDGTDPTTSETALLTDGNIATVTINSAMTVRAVAVNGDGQFSDEVSASYTIAVPVIVVNPKGLDTEYYVQATSLDDIEDGDAIMFVESQGSSYMGMTTFDVYNPAFFGSVTFPLIYPETSVQLTASEAADLEKFVVKRDGDKFYFYASRSNINGFLSARSNTEPAMLVSDQPESDAAITFDNDGNATVVFQNSAFAYNILGWNTSTQWNCYNAATGVIKIFVESPTATPVTGDYVKVTSSSELTDGEYLIVYEEGSLAFNGSLDVLDASGNTVSVTIDNNTIASTTAVDAATFTIDVAAGTIKSASGLYIGQTSDANGLKTATTAYENTISIDADGNAVIVSSSGPYLRYNANSGQDRFRYFKSSTYSSQKPIALYKKSSTPTPGTPSITLPGGYEYTMDAKAGGGEIPVVCENLAADPQLAVVFVEPDGQTSATYDWISATINSNGNIYGQITANTSDAPRTAYFVVSGKADDGSTVYSNLVTFTQNGRSIRVKGTLEFTAEGGGKTVNIEYGGLENPAFEVRYYEADGATSATYDWVLATITSENKIDFTIATNTGAARTAYFKVYDTVSGLYSELATIVQEATVEASIEINETSISISADGENRTVGFDYSNFGGSTIPTFEVRFYEADGTTDATYDWISSKITDNSKVDLFVSANTGDARTAYFKVYGVNGAKSALSDLVTISQAAQGVVTSTKYAKVTSNSDIEDGKNYILVYEDENDPVVFTGEISTTSTKYGLTASTTYTASNEVDISGLDVTPIVINAGTAGYILKVGENYLSWASGNSLTVSGNEYEWTIDVENGEAKSAISSAQASDRFLQYNSGANPTRFACYTSAQKYVALYKEVSTPTPTEEITVNVSAVGYSTLYYSNKSLKIPASSSVRAYTMTFDEATSKLSEGDQFGPGDVIPADVAVVLEESNHEAASVQMQVVNDPEYLPLYTNYLYGYDEDTAIQKAFANSDNYKFYVLSRGSQSGKIGFFWYGDQGGPFVTAAHKAFLALPSSAASNIRGFEFDGNATAIQSVENNAKVDGKIYDLQGRRVQNAGKGLYIINGKKVIK